RRSVFLECCAAPRALPSFPTRRSSDLEERLQHALTRPGAGGAGFGASATVGVLSCVLFALRAAGYAHAFARLERGAQGAEIGLRSEEHTSELQSRENLVCRLLLEKKKY